MSGKSYGSGISWSCKNHRHSACAKLKCPCDCHKLRDPVHTKTVKRDNRLSAPLMRFNSSPRFHCNVAATTCPAHSSASPAPLLTTTSLPAQIFLHAIANAGGANRECLIRGQAMLSTSLKRISPSEPIREHDQFSSNEEHAKMTLLCWANQLGR